jgi:hypothetical protein
VNVRTLTITAALTALAGTTVIRTFATDVVQIRLHGHYFSEPATIEIVVAVEPDAANRTLRVEADGDRLFRSTEVNLDGESDKKLHTVEFKNLPAGSYELRAEVLSNSSVRGMATEELVVAGVGAGD